jgi:hypothetical protein
MSGDIRLSADVWWSATWWLFDWVLKDITKSTRDVELVGHLNGIVGEHLGCFRLDDITPNQRREVHRIIAERLVSDADREFPADMPGRQGALGLLKDLANMASGAPEPVIVDILHEEFEIWRQTLPETAVATFEEFPRPSGAGRAVRVTVETLPRVAEATMWESGEVDLVSGNLTTGDIDPMEHMELMTRLGVRGLLADLAWAVGT